MKQFTTQISLIKKVAQDYYVLEFKWQGEIPLPGQFVTIRTAETNPLLRRPFAFSAYDSKTGTASVLFQERGKGTQILKNKSKGDNLDVLGPLGTSFPMDLFEQKDLPPVILAGGIGTGPMLFLAETISKKTNPYFILGCRNKEYVPFSLLSKLKQAIICTDDGSEGFKGTVIDYLVSRQADLSLNNRPIGACGPLPMLKACHYLAQKKKALAYVSLEAMMACGVGACQGCAVKTNTKDQYKRVCKDGPVFRSEVISWT